ncbi:T9SS type A sorting domain-containing protein [Ekhidna sp.]
MRTLLITTLIFLSLQSFSQISLRQSFSGDNYFQDFVEHDGAFYGFKVTASTSELVKIFSEELQVQTLTDISGTHPESILISDNKIFFTVSINTWQGRLYSYDLSSSSLSTLKDFSSSEGQIVSVKQLKDGVLWGFSWTSSEDEGSIFTIKPDGTEFQKIYSVPNSDNGSTPVDITVFDDKVIIAWINGGGIPYQDSFGDSYTSGSFGMYDLETQTHTTILQGEDLKGTSPYTVLHHNDVIYAGFEGAGNSSTGKLYAIDSETFESELIYDLDKNDLARKGFDRLIPHNGYIYGIERFGIFRYHIEDQTSELLFDFKIENYESNSALLISSEGDIYSFINILFNSETRFLAEFITPSPLSVDRASAFRIFPNPTSNELKIQDSGLNYVEILDLNGRIIKSIKDPKNSIDVTSLEEGVYLLKFRVDDQVYTQKFVKRQ